MKKILFFILGLLFSASATAQQANIYNVFMPKYQKKLTSLVENYQQGNPHALDIRIFDIANPTLKNFLKNSKHAAYNDVFLAVTYYEDFQVNNQKTPFCFVMYDSTRQNLLDNYLAPYKADKKVRYQSAVFFDEENMIDYLVHHEFGHCAVFNHIHYNEIKPVTDREHEMLADMFSIAYFVLNKKDITDAEKIIKLNHSIEKEDNHSNGEELEKFLDIIKQINENPKNAYELFTLTYDIYSKKIKK